jgi:hypothetical protein
VICVSFIETAATNGSLLLRFKVLVRGTPGQENEDGDERPCGSVAELQIEAIDGDCGVILSFHW